MSRVRFICSRLCCARRFIGFALHRSAQQGALDVLALAVAIFLEGGALGEMVDPLAGAHAEVVVALHADIVVVLEGFGFHHLAAAGALEPHSFRHAGGALGGGLFLDAWCFYFLKRRHAENPLRS